MDASHIALNQGLTFLAIATGLIVLIVGGFLVKLLVDLSRLTKNVDETTTIVKTEIEPTLEELKKALQSINSIAQNADKQVDSLSKLLESVFGVGSLALLKAKKISGGLLKGIVKGAVTVFKMVIKK